jgi:hypothetical protein
VCQANRSWQRWSVLNNLGFISGSDLKKGGRFVGHIQTVSIMEGPRLYSLVIGKCCNPTVCSHAGRYQSAILEIAASQQITRLFSVNHFFYVFNDN